MSPAWRHLDPSGLDARVKPVHDGEWDVISARHLVLPGEA